MFLICTNTFPLASSFPTSLMPSPDHFKIIPISLKAI